MYTLHLQQSSFPRMNVTTLEKAFCPLFSHLFPKFSHNLGVYRGQWFRHAVLPRSRHYHSFRVLVAVSIVERWPL